MTQNALSEAAKTWERSHLEHIMNILKVSVDLGFDYKVGC